MSDNIFTMIEDAEGTGKLDLSGKVKNEQIPKELFDLADALVSLNLDNNNLHNLPNDLGKLVALKDISLYRNLLTSLPDELVKCSELEEINITRNKFTSFPSILLKFKALHILKLGSNQITSIDFTFSTLENLLEIDLSNCQLVSLSSGFCSLPKIRTINLQHNTLHTLPYEIGNLKTLKNLYLDHNPITALPLSITNCTLNRTSYSSPPGTAIEQITVKDCPLSNPPPNVVSFGVKAMMEHLSKQLNTALVTCEGVGLKEASAGEECSFTIILPRSSSCPVDVNISGASSVTPTLQSHGTNITCLYTALVSGDYDINVRISDKHVKGSPFKSTVKQGAVYAKSCVVSMPSTAIAGHPVRGTVVLKDRFGNIYSISDRIPFTVDGLVHEIKYENNAYSVLMSPSTAGPVDVSVIIDGIPAVGSPFHMVVLQDPDVVHANLLKTANDEKMELERLRAEADARLVEMAKEKAASERKFADMERRIAEIEAKNAEAERRRAESEAKVADMMKKNAQAEATIAEMEHQNAQAEAKAAQMELKNAEIAGASAVSESKYSEIEHKRSEAEAKLADLKKKHDDAEAKLMEMERKSAEAEARVSELMHKHADAEARSLDMESKCSAAEKRLIAMEVKYAEKEREMEELRRAMDTKTVESQPMESKPVVEQQPKPETITTVPEKAPSSEDHNNKTNMLAEYKQEVEQQQQVQSINIVYNVVPKKHIGRTDDNMSQVRQHHYVPGKFTVPLEPASSEPDWVKNLKNKKKK